MHPYIVDVESCQKGLRVYAHNLEDAVDQIKQSFLKAHPYILPKDIPIEMVTPAGNIVDSKITIRAAQSQITRIATARGIQKSTLDCLIQENMIQSSDGEQVLDVIRLNAKLNEI